MCHRDSFPLSRNFHPNTFLHRHLLLVNVLLLVIWLCSTIEAANTASSEAAPAPQDDLAAIANAVPDPNVQKELTPGTPEKFSCTHLHVGLSWNFLKVLLGHALNEKSLPLKNPSTTKKVTSLVQGDETTAVSRQLFNVGNDTGISSEFLKATNVFITDAKIVDTFFVPGRDGPNMVTGPHQIDVKHGWAKMTMVGNMTYSYHTLVYRKQPSNEVVAVWKGQVLVDSASQVYQSQWTGSSVSLDDPRYLVNVSWNLNSKNGQGCWFGDSISYEHASRRNLTQWTHLMEYPGNGSWSGFVLIKNLLEKSAPTQFWAGSGNSTVDMLAKSNWKDYTHIWLGTEEDASLADKNLSRGWIWTMLISVFVLCVFLSWLVYYLTSERTYFKGKRRSSLMAFIARSKNRLRSSDTTASTTATTTTSV